MRQLYLLFSFFIIVPFIGFSQTLTTIAQDNAGNYSGTWTNGNNNGSGFESWVLTNNPNGGFAGNYVGGTAIGDPAFGLFSGDNAAAESIAERGFSQNMQPGDTFSVDIGHTNGINGQLGIVLLNGNTPVLTLKYVQFATSWVLNDGGSDFGISQGYVANTSLTFTFTFEGSNEYSYTFGSASGNNFTFNGAVSNVDGVRFFNVNQGGSQNFGINNLSITRPTYTTIADGDFNSAATWQNGDLPDASNGKGKIEIKHNVTLNTDLTVQGELIVDAGKSLAEDTTPRNLTNNGSIVLNSTSSTYSSLIVGGTYSGSGAVTYNRYTAQVGPTGTNDLVSSPVSGLLLGTFLTNNSSALAQNGSGPTVYAFAPFDNANDYANASQHYVNYDSNTATTTALTSGEGYRAGTVNGETLAFTGGITTGDVTLASFGVGASTSYGHWNLIGNPYPSYILLSEFLTQNTTKFDTNSAGVYGYGGDISSNGWTQWGQAFSDANPGTLMAPGQGFFVASNGTNTATALFTSAMRSTGNSDDFINRNSNPHVGLVELSMNSSTANFSTDIYFNTNASQGLDIGYDMSLFGGSAPAFALYSHLVQDNNGVPMGVQTLGGNDLDNITIPLGVNANQGEQLTFNITNSDLSSGINIYLDDTEAGSSTLLNSGDFIVTPTTNLTGTGRFYIRFANSVLSTPEHAFNDVSIYANQSNRTINIAGQLTNDSAVNIYDIQGRLMVSQPLNTESNLQIINANTFTTGIYLVQLSDGTITRTEKIILK